MVWQLAGLPQQQQETPATCMQMAVPDLGTFHHALLDHGPLHGCLDAGTYCCIYRSNCREAKPVFTWTNWTEL